MKLIMMVPVAAVSLWLLLRETKSTRWRFKGIITPGLSAADQTTWKQSFLSNAPDSYIESIDTTPERTAFTFTRTFSAPIESPKPSKTSIGPYIFELVTEGPA